MIDNASGTDDRQVGLSGLSAVLQFVDDVVVALLADGTITFASPAIRTVLGWDPADLVGRNVLGFIAPEDLDATVSNLTRWSGREGLLQANPLRALTATGEHIEVGFFVITGDSVSDLGDYVVTLRPTATSDSGRDDLIYRLANESRIVRLASTFLALGPDNFNTGLDEATLELAGLKFVTRVSIWHREGPSVVRRTLWASAEHAPTTPLPGAVPIAHLPVLSSLQEVHYRTPAEIEGGPWAEAGKWITAGGVQAMLVIPMTLGGQFTGLVMMEHTFPGVAFDSTHFSTGRAAAAILAEAFARNEAERELAARANTDLLTGLPNRWQFQQVLVGMLDRVAIERGFGLAVALFDLDRFKIVNDSLGHEAGDRLLREVADRLRTATSDPAAGEAVVARLGGDEFLVLVAGCADESEAASRISVVLGALDPPFEYEGQLFRLTASGGLAFVRDAAISADELLRWADEAMFRVKRRGGAQLATADPRAQSASANRLGEEALLRRAVERSERDARGGGTLGDGGHASGAGGAGGAVRNGDGRDPGRLLTYLQGEWDLVSGDLVGAEALVRWQHPDHGLRAASEFIALAEESDLVIPIGEAVLRTGCAWLASSRDQGFDAPFVLRVNLSVRQLRQPSILDTLASVLDETGLDPSQLCLELTESSLLTDPRAAEQTLGRIRELGCGLAIDDFGTGYSSLLYMKRLPMTSVKIDRIFVAGLPDDPADRVIIRSVVEMAGALGITVTAEGVETEPQRAALLEIGCTRAQGYLLSAPEPIEEFAKRIAVVV